MRFSTRSAASGIKMSLGSLPLDPHALAGLPIADRAALYAQLELDLSQREVAEEAVCAVQEQKYFCGRIGSDERERTYLSAGR